MGFFTIPKSYREPKIFAIAARIKSGDRWDFPSLRKLIKDPEFREFYYNLKSDLEILDLEIICRKNKINLFISENNKIESFGEGKEVYLKILTKPSIRFFVEDFLYHPDGLGKACLHMHEILQQLEFENLSTRQNYLLSNQEFLKMESEFKISIEVWSKISSGTHFLFEKLRFGTCKYEKILEIHYNETTKKFYPITNHEKYFANFFPCKNRVKGCLYVFNAKSKLIKHETTCSDVQSFRVKQTEYGNNTNLIDKLIKLGHLSKRPVNDNFCFFAIECVCPKIDSEFGKTKILASHKLLSIAVNKFINGKHEQKCWVVEDNSKISETKIVEKFLNFCREAQKEMKIPDEVILAYETLSRYKTLNGAKFLRHDEIFRLKRILESYIELPIFGFNSSKYDNNVIFNHIVKTLDNISNESEIEKFNPSSMSILKKGTKYFSIKFEHLHFKDLLNFTCPMSLDRYLKVWTDNFEKLVYPYEHFSSISEIRACRDFPKIEHFNTVLKGEIDQESYDKCLKIYNSRRNLPEDHKDHWKSFEDYLIYYNISDVYPASLAMIRQFQTFEQNFGRSPIQFLGLPSFASESMYNLYDKNCPNIFSFSKNSSATQVFRSQIIGGLVNVFKRHVTLLEESAPDAAKYNKNGRLMIINNKFSLR